MSTPLDIVASFAGDHECADAINELRRAEIRVERVFQPFPSEKISEALGEPEPKSPVRAWVLAGGIIGALSGFALTIGLSADWPHVTGGKPIISIPPFIIIAFELMILFGASAAVVGFLIHGRFPRFESVPRYSPRFSGDRFGIVVRCGEPDRARVEAILKQAGAEEIESDAG